MNIKPDTTQLTMPGDWPMFLSLEQREQLLQGKIDRARAALLLVTSDRCNLNDYKVST